jgi:hypothetical protein
VECRHRQRNSYPVVLREPDLHIHAQPNKWLGRRRNTVHRFTVSWTGHHILGWNQMDPRCNSNTAGWHHSDRSYQRNVKVRLLHRPQRRLGSGATWNTCCDTVPLGWHRLEPSHNITCNSGRNSTRTEFSLHDLASQWLDRWVKPRLHVDLDKGAVDNP